MMQYDILHDCDDEDGTPTCWYAKDPLGFYWWIDLNRDGSFTCATKLYGEFTRIKPVKTMTSAKRWISANFARYAEQH